MHNSRIRFCTAVLFVLTFMTGASTAILFSQSTASKGDRLHHLLNEKLTTLQTMVTQMEKLHEHREMGLKDLYEARVAMLRAKLDLCTSNDERIAVLEDLLNEAKVREEKFQNLPKTEIKGVPQEAYELKIEQAKVDRLDVEIEIERLKSKQEEH